MSDAGGVDLMGVGMNPTPGRIAETPSIYFSETARVSDGVVEFLDELD